MNIYVEAANQKDSDALHVEKSIHERRNAEGLEARHFDLENLGLQSLGLFAVGKGAAQEKRS